MAEAGARKAGDPDSDFARRALQEGLVTAEQLRDALVELHRLNAKGAARPLREILVERGHLKEPPPFGKYRLVRELGRGGMGVVYEAVDAGLGRKVALKTMIPASSSDPSEEERFLQEARLAASLPKHPHIVGVYEAGIVAGRRYIAMELIQGEPLSEWRRVEGRTAKQEIEILRDAALAVHHAHEGGIIHRDLKPQNILVDVQGRPHITDFGLAKTVGKDLSLSLTGAGLVVGTPAYISPEQAQGLKTTDRRTDVYALGVILFETLTGRQPFQGDTAMEVMMKAAKNPVPPPSSLLKLRITPVQARGLETVCLKALQKNPKDRYPDAAAFASDLGRWLKGEEIKSFSRTRRLRRDRSRSWIGLAAAVALAVALAAVAFSRPSPPLPEPREGQARLRALEAELKVIKDRLQPAAVHRDPASLRPGVVAEFFSGSNFDVPCVRRVDPRIEFKGKESWLEAPAELVSLRWSGYIEIFEPGAYAFQTSGPDGARLFVDDVEVFSIWVPRPRSTDSGVAMLARGLHRVRLERFQGSFAGPVEFSWKGGGTLHDPAGLQTFARKPSWDHADRASLPGAREAETLPILFQKPEATFVLPYGRGQGLLVWGRNTQRGDRLRVGFDAEKARGTLVLALLRAKNAAVVSIALNDRVLQPRLDLYNLHNHTLEVEFRDVELRIGPNQLEFTIVDSNKAAVEWRKGDGLHKMALDYVRIR